MNHKSWKSRVRGLLLLLTTPLLLVGCNKSNPKTPEAAEEMASPFIFEESEHDFGVIKQSGGIVQHDFTFTYQGENPISILSTPGSCACTTGEVDKKELTKGERATLTVFFHPNLHAEPIGRFSKTVSIVTEPPISPLPEVTVWQEIDLDLGEEFFELSGGGHTASVPDHSDEYGAEEHEEAEENHSSNDHGSLDEIAHDGSVDPLSESNGIRRFQLTAQEINAPLADGVEYFYWAFGDTVPGPFMRARVGETIEVNLKNPATNHMSHSLDLHAVNGPGGGATEVYPGEEKSFRFKALNEGVFVYHCATPEVAEHIANGMYGLIVIEPKEGLSPVDKEYYVMQGEIYSVHERGEKGKTHLSGKKLNDETPEYIIFNGRTGSLIGDRALQAEVGDTVRLFFGNGGVSKVSSFHVIGEIFDTVYPEGGTPVHHNIQTTIVPAGGATIVEFTVDVPGTYKIVDHALARLSKGAVGELIVSGEQNPDVFQKF